LCWIPIIFMSIASYSGYHLPDIVHPISSIVFLPINSFLNPIIYSRLDRPIWRLVKKLCSEICNKCFYCFYFLCDAVIYVVRCKCCKKNKQTSSRVVEIEMQECGGNPPNDNTWEMLQSILIHTLPRFFNHIFTMWLKTVLENVL
jgi:hypothetical protein